MSSDAAVLLDIDGTLLDTNHLHVLAWARGFRRFDLNVPMVAIHHHIGMAGERLIAELIGPEAPDGLAEARKEEFGRLRGDVRALPGARDLIRILDASGVKVVLASSSDADELAFFRTVLDVDEHLAGSTSADDAEDAKPAPDILLAALGEVDVPVERAIMIGDTVWDVKAADAAGIDAVGVLSGGIDRSDLIAAGALAVYSGADALVGNLDSSPLVGLLDRPRRLTR